MIAWYWLPVTAIICGSVGAFVVGILAGAKQLREEQDREVERRLAEIGRY